MSMITGCACKRGFLVLRDCGAAATATCNECSRPVCAEHFVEEWLLCVDCAGRRDEALGLAAAPEEEQRRAARRGAYARQRYYHARNYDPFLAGWPTHYYDAYDVRAFDDDVDPALYDQPGPSFLDS